MVVFAVIDIAGLERTQPYATVVSIVWGYVGGTLLTGLLYASRYIAKMGIYLNPGNEVFRQALHSEIYVDKTGLIVYTNQVLATERISASAARADSESPWQLTCSVPITAGAVIPGNCSGI